MWNDSWTNKEDEEDDLPFDQDTKYTKKKLEEWADKLLKEDSNRELCRICKELHIKSPKKQPNPIPYGIETGNIESKPQYYKETGEPIVDDEGNQLYVDYPEFICEKSHRWYKGEGPRRDIRGPNPILFESHIYDRMRREIFVNEGTPDPAFSMDRFGRPGHLIYNRSSPNGRRVNSEISRKSSGSSYYA